VIITFIFKIQIVHVFFNRNLDAQTEILKTLTGLYFGIRNLCFKKVLKSPFMSEGIFLKIQRTFFRKTVLRKNLFSCEILLNFSKIFLQICNRCKILYVFNYFDTHMAFFEKKKNFHSLVRLYVIFGNEKTKYAK
jgi:hypothetical protein